MSIGKRTFQSAGQISQHLIPGAFSRVDSVKGLGGLASANNGVVMGKCTGGEPAVLYQFNTISEAVNTLKGGELMEAVRQAMNPGNDLVPQKLFAMRVNTALQSTYTMLATADPMIKLTSLDYGLSRNQLTAALAAGTNYGRKLTIGFKDAEEVLDDMYRPSITIEYTVSADTLTVVNNSTTNTLVTTGANAQTIDLNDYATIGDLAAFLNNEAGYVATVTAGEEDASSLELDEVTALDINTAAKTLESTMHCIIDTINSLSVYVSAEDMSAAVGITLPTNFTTIYMTGGSEGTYTATEWTAALVALEAEDVQFIATPSTDAAVHAVIATHCATMGSVTGRKERQFLLGGPWDITVDDAISAANVLNTKNGLYAYNGYTQRDVFGTIQNYPASYTAALLMGQKCSGAINMPLTFNMLNVISLESKLRDSQLEALIAEGVCPANYNSSGIPHCVRQVNTYLVDDLKYNEFSMVAEMNFCSRDIRAYLESTFVGKAGSNFSVGIIRGAVESKLAQYTDLGIFTSDGDKAWWNVQVTISGDTVTIDYDAYITAPINFVFVTQHFHEVVAA